MAYTFTDHYRPVRIILRLNGILIGGGLGLTLLLYPAALLSNLGFATDVAWTTRIGGAALLGLGLDLLFASSEPEPPFSSLLSAMLSNGLIAISLLIAYFQNELTPSTGPGYALLIGIFVLALLTAVLPIPYVRTESHR